MEHVALSIDQGDHQILYTQGLGDELWVTFGGRGAREGPFLRIIESRNASALHVISLTDDWYQAFDATALLAEIARHRKGRVILAGVSMGGFGALAYSGLINPDIVLVAGPQTLVDHSLSRGHDDRFRGEWDNIDCVRPDAVAGMTTTAPVRVIADLMCREDRWHAQRITGGKVHSGNARFFGHEALDTIRLAGRFVEFMNCWADGTPHALEDEVRRIGVGRRNSRHYWSGLSDLAAHRGRIDLAHAVLYRAVEMDPGNADYSSRLRTLGLAG